VSPCAGELSAPVRVGAAITCCSSSTDAPAQRRGEQDAVFDIVQVVFPLPARPSEANRQAAIREAASVRAARTIARVC